MRKANTNDLFNIARLINELGLKEDFFKAQKGKEDLEEIGYNFIFDVLVKTTSKESQNKIYEVLAEPFEMPAEKVGLLEIDKLIEYTMSCFNFKTVINFIKRANLLK